MFAPAALNRTAMAMGLLVAASSPFAQRCVAQPDQDDAVLRVARFLDADADHQIDSQELGSAQELAAAVGQLDLPAADSDADGVLSIGELSAALIDALAAPEEQKEPEDAEAESALADALSLGVLLQQLSGQQGYADEIARLREAVEDLEDEDATVQYLITNSTSYPRLYPTIRTWARHYPVKPNVRKHFGPRHRPPAGQRAPHAGPKPKPAAKPAKPPRPGHP